MKLYYWAAVPHPYQLLSQLTEPWDLILSNYLLKLLTQRILPLINYFVRLLSCRTSLFNNNWVRLLSCRTMSPLSTAEPEYRTSPQIDYLRLLSCRTLPFINRRRSHQLPYYIGNTSGVNGFTTQHSLVTENFTVNTIISLIHCG